MFNTKQIMIMKKTKLSLAALTFVAGIVLGISVMGLISFTSPDPATGALQGVNKIGVPEAYTLFHGYYDNASSTNQIVKGFSISKEQLSAINYLSNENPSLSAFRVYMGFDEREGNVGIVVGVNSTGQDVTNSIYKASGGAALCPTICDVASGITRK